jgi:hypothetical protein
MDRSPSSNVTKISGIGFGTPGETQTTSSLAEIMTHQWLGTILFFIH